MNLPAGEGARSRMDAGEARFGVRRLDAALTDRSPKKFAVLSEPRKNQSRYGRSGTSCPSESGVKPPHSKGTAHTGEECPSKP